MIVSLQNKRAKYVQALHRRRSVRQREQRFVFEGMRLVEEAVTAGVSPVLVFYVESLEADDRGARLLATLREMNVPCEAVSAAVMAACADTKTPQGILAVLPIPDLDDLRPEKSSFTLVLDRVRDPGNLGTILRSALAAGVEQVLLAPGTVDATNSKAVRAAMGAHLYLPVKARRWKAIKETIIGSDIWLAAARSETLYTTVDWGRPTTLIVGGEASGAAGQARALAKGQIFIPMAPGVESLNTAVATAVILFEAVRQRTAHTLPVTTPCP